MAIPDTPLPIAPQDRVAYSLRLENLSHRFGFRHLFDDLNLVVKPGECLAIMGPNGSGKTTLTRILAGLTRPARGSAHLLADEKPLEGSSRRNALGLVTPDIVLDPELTAQETLQFHAQMRDLPPGSEEALLDYVGLGSRGEDRVRTFSSGMRQRLKYAFALQHRPPFLFLDEPTANLDAQGGALVERIRADQLQRGVLVIATNEPREAEGADHTLRLDAVFNG